MIRSETTTLTKKNIAKFIALWEKDLSRLQINDNLYTNKANLKIPYAKKLVTTSASATLGDGITLSAPQDLTETQLETFERLLELYKKQTIDRHDLKVFVGMCKLGRTYELAYMSNDEKPVPKLATYSALNAFVVYDTSVENNSIFGVYLDWYDNKTGKVYKVNVTDDTYTYSFEIDSKSILTLGKGEFDFGENENLDKIEHHMDRVPLTEIINNDEEQADFEQVIELIQDRTTIHNLNLKDFEEIAKNVMKARNIKFAGKTDEEKRLSKLKMAQSQIMEIDADQDAPGDDVTILSKNEDYSSVDIFGKDTERNIYDKAMIVDFSSEEFAGNQSGVALELKYKAMIAMVESKDGEIEKLYRRRNKMYIHGLVKAGFAAIDAADITININRSWLTNIEELARIIQTLQLTGFFSDKYLTNKMPDADYEEQQAQLDQEREIKSKRQPQDFNFNNSQGADYLGALRMLGTENEEL